ncbi:helix-turn-helix domain-containing protein [Pseudomonas cichorii]|nr:helix-turn-helix transcriptional regulator [Pseudomonas cichorii]MBX8493200.1 helix-turn-helix domain-containing protein [Pseudomonas cichorii]
MGISNVTHWRLATSDEIQHPSFRGSLPTECPFDPSDHEEYFRHWHYHKYHYLGEEREIDNVEQTEDVNSYAYKLKTKREAANLSQLELAERSGVSLAQIRKYESGASKPRYGALYDLAKALNVSPDFFE